MAITLDGKLNALLDGAQLLNPLLCHSQLGFRSLQFDGRPSQHLLRIHVPSWVVHRVKSSTALTVVSDIHAWTFTCRPQVPRNSTVDLGTGR